MTDSEDEFYGGLWPTMGKIKRIHFVGIAGSGMSGIAEVLHNLGYQVSGSDLADNAVTKRLKSLGITVLQGHRGDHVRDVDVIVKSTAVGEENPEVVAAHEKRLPVVARAEMLAELMRFRFGLAVAGTHGKTTTTSLIASVLAEGGLDPTFVIGGQLNSAGANAKLGASRYLVAEADESDASFLYLQPMMSVVTNIDRDHMSTYGDFEKLKETFLAFLHHMPFYGTAVVCVDDPVVRELLNHIGRTTITYGIDEPADIRAYDIEYSEFSSHFKVAFKQQTQDQETGKKAKESQVRLNLPGRHNVLNALAAVAIARELGLDMATISTALSRFEGIARRFQQYGQVRIKGRQVMLLDDYGHHPTEIEAVLQAVKAGWPGRRLVLAFQPHRYSRTRDLFEDFVKVLSRADVLILLDVYAAGEAVIEKVDGRALSRAVRARGGVDPVFVESVDELPQVLPGIVNDGDILLTMGAGNIGNAASLIRKVYAN